MLHELPDELRPGGFSVRDARRVGMTAGVLRGNSLHRPFHGVRTEGATDELAARARALHAVLRPWHALGGVTAAALLGLPVPRRLMATNELHVISPQAKSRPRRAGVRVRRIDDACIDTWDLAGARVTTPALTWALCAHDMTVHELVVLGDAIVSAFDRYPGRVLRGPLATIGELKTMVDRWAARPGAETMRRALLRIRSGVESPRETDVRLLIVDAGMPEPDVQVEVRHPRTGLLLGRADLMHREARVVEEYEGDHHRSKEQWDRDIAKYRAFEEVGIHVERATNRDLTPSPHAWLARLARILEARSPRK